MDERGRGLSLAERLVRLPVAARARVIERIPAAARPAVARSWELVARPAQLAPAGDWSVWLILAGRGFGKTRAGAEWVSARALAEPGARFALVGPTLHDAVSVMLDGESGLMAVAPAGNRPEWHASRREVRWPNGARAAVVSAVDPDSLRGPQFHYAWCDEIAAWPRPAESWANLRMGLRLGQRPRVVVTTTPRPLPFLRDLQAGRDVVVTRGSTYDNRANLPASYLADVTAAWGSTTLGRQELLGELLDGHAGALWTPDGLDACRVAEAPELVRVVVGVDPPAGPGGCGIVVAGVDAAGVGYVLADASVENSAPETWARAVAAAHARHEADRVVAEVNNGGEMVVATLRAADVSLPIRQVRASRGKAARAEPVSALYAAGRVRHVGCFPVLEDQLCGLILGGGYVGPGSSPDHADALVWALTELMLGGPAKRPGIRILAS